MSDIEGAATPRVNITLESMQQLRADEQAELSAEMLTAKDALLNYLQEAVNPFPKLPKTQKPIETQRGRIQKMLKMGEKSEQSLPLQHIKDKADQFQRQNPELKASVLTLLRERIKPGDTKEEILKKIFETYPDVSLADEALDFLLETTEGELHQTIQSAKEDLNTQFGREIAAGRNISTYARQASEKGLGSPTNMRDLYREITGNPRDPVTLFQEFSQKYAFKELKKVVDFLLHSLGSDMKAKGSSIPRGQLHRLITETRSLQAILGVYRFFRGRMGLMESLFEKQGLKMPPQLNFETMAKQFMTLASDRYPSGEKALQTAIKLGIDKWITAKIIALSQMRDAIREVAVNQIYRSIQHRDELYLAILEALEELEDELEEYLEREESEEEGEEEGEEEKEENEEPQQDSIEEMK